MSLRLGAFVASWSLPAFTFCAPAVAAPESSAVEPVAVAPDSARLGRLSEDLARAHWVRVSAAGGQFELTDPRVAADGLGYSRAKGFPAARPALITGPGVKRPASPPNPVRWSEIERVEVRQQDWGPGAPLGGGLGIWGGLVLAPAAAWIVGYSTRSITAGMVTFCAVPVTLGVIGAYAMGSESKWVEVYPTRAAQASDGSATSTRAFARRN